MIPLGMVSKKRISDCIVCVEDTRQKAEDKFYNKRWNEGPHHKFEGYVAPTFPEGRPLKHKYTDKTEHQREDSWHLIKQCQVAYVLPGLCWAAVGANFKALYYADLIPEQYPWILLTIVGNTISSMGVRNSYSNTVRILGPDFQVLASLVAGACSTFSSVLCIHDAC